jgi:hypothetical protein
VRLFLDSSVLLAASGSAVGASREIFERSARNHWTLIVTPYVIHETTENARDIGWEMVAEWVKLRPKLLVMDDILTIDRPVVFEPGKDRPILFGAYGWSDILLTLDRGDFGGLLGDWFYDLLVLTPGMFLKQERVASRLL